MFYISGNFWFSTDLATSRFDVSVYDKHFYTIQMPWDKLVIVQKIFYPVSIIIPLTFFPPLPPSLPLLSYIILLTNPLKTKIYLIYCLLPLIKCLQSSARRCCIWRVTMLLELWGQTFSDTCSKKRQASFMIALIFLFLNREIGKKDKYNTKGKLSRQVNDQPVMAEVFFIFVS